MQTFAPIFHISLYITLSRLQTKQFHVITHSFSPQVFLSLQFTPATSRFLLVDTQSFALHSQAKPSQSAMPYQLAQTRNTHKTVQCTNLKSSLLLFILQ